MKKTKTGISILSALLIISVACIGAVQVQAAEANINEGKAKIGELVSELETYMDSNDLSALEDIVDDVFEFGASEALARDYIDALGGTNTDENEDYESLLSLADEIKDYLDLDVESSASFSSYYVGVDSEGLSVTTSITEDQLDDYVLVDASGPSIDGLSQEEWAKIMDFKDNLMNLFLYSAIALAAVIVVAIALFIVQAIVAAIATGLGTLLSAVFGVALVIGVVMVVLIAVNFMLDFIAFLRELINGNGDEEDEEETSTVRPKPFLKLVSRMQQLLSRVFTLFQNLQLS